jgi:integrase
MKTKFYLRKGTQKMSITFEFRNGVKTKFRASTGFILRNEKEWDSVKQKIKLPSSTPNASLINAKLSELNSHIDKLFYDYGGSAVSLDNISFAFDTVFGTTKTASKNKNICFLEDKVQSGNNSDFLQYYDWFLDFYSLNNSPYTKKPLTSGTLRTLKNSRTMLKKYIDGKKLTTLYFDDINRQFYNDFVMYLNDKNYSKNYIGTVIQKIKTVMGYAYEEGKHTNLEYKKYYFATMTEVVNHPYLDISELAKIELLEIHQKEMSVSRDIFLVGCNTGLRIGDLLSFIKNPKLIKKGKRDFIPIKQGKTDNPVVIPINSTIVNIMAKYNGEFPPYLHQNIINKNLKLICKRAKIDTPYEYSRTEGGKSITHSNPKFKYISTHTARRSFCTNAYYSGVPVQDIMAISGHKTEKVFYNYIKVDVLDNATRIADNPFFK